jgi:hypothetical protein
MKGSGIMILIILRIIRINLGRGDRTLSLSKFWGLDRTVKSANFLSWRSHISGELSGDLSGELSGDLFTMNDDVEEMGKRSHSRVYLAMGSLSRVGFVRFVWHSLYELRRSLFYVALGVSRTLMLIVFRVCHFLVVFCLLLILFCWETAREIFWIWVF